MVSGACSSWSGGFLFWVWTRLIYILWGAFLGVFAGFILTLGNNKNFKVPCKDAIFFFLSDSDWHCRWNPHSVFYFLISKIGNPFVFGPNSLGVGSATEIWMLAHVGDWSLPLLLLFVNLLGFSGKHLFALPIFLAYRFSLIDPFIIFPHSLMWRTN